MYCIGIQSFWGFVLFWEWCSSQLSFFSLSSPILSDSYVTFFHIKAFVGFETNNKYKICNSMGQQVYFAAEGMFNKSNNILMSSLGPGSPLWEKGANISVGYRSSRFTRQYFSYLTPFFALRGLVPTGYLMSFFVCFFFFKNSNTAVAIKLT